ncbi:MAG: hypothetical protein HFACDABA_02183 [Anaerolineales bacterium]|nr:hypothetical protein [Anaerolineales bacterium]
MNPKPQISNVVFTILVSMALIASMVVTSPARASAPSAKATPPVKATPTQTVTETPVPTVEPVEMAPAISLQPDPTYITSGGQVTITYQITDFQKIVGTPALRFLAPDGLSPVSPEEGKWDEEEQSFYLQLSDIEGKILWQADETITPPVTLVVELTQDGETVAKAEIILDELVEFKVEPTGGEADGMNGKVQVTFPGGAVAETVIVKVTRPSEQALPVQSLSGAPFEITAVSDSSKADVSQFSQPVEIIVSYNDEGMTNEGTTMLYWYDEVAGEWKLPLSQRIDTLNNKIIATTDHFTVFDTYTSNWQSAETPTMSFFQTPGFTGAASFSLPIKVPAGAGGLQPSLSLSYSSSTADNVTNASQASWAGMGWSIAESYIEHNTNGTEGDPFANGTLKSVDDTFQLNLNGTSMRLFKDANDAYHAEDEQFYKVAYDSNAEQWIVWDKGGTKYTFGSVTSRFSADYDDENNCHLDQSPWRWSLSEVRNIYGQTITYSYENETKTFGGCGINLNHPTYKYPKAITYSGGRYRVYFDRLEANESNHRTDLKSIWTAPTSYQAFQRSLLEAIRVEQDADGNGAFETLIRKYQFTYCNSAACSIFPKLIWGEGGRTPTLVSVQEFGLNGTNSLPAYNFAYSDGMHLTSASNGYGGTITYIYNNQTNYTQSPQDAWHAVDGGNPLKIDHTLDGWTGCINYYVVDGKIQDAAMLCGQAQYTQFNNVKSFQPGRWYKVVARAKRAGASSYLSLGYSYQEDGSWSAVSYSPAVSLSQQYQEVESEPFFLPVNATDIRPYLNKTSGGFSIVDWVRLVPLPTVSRVTSRTLSSGSDNYTYNYAYENPHTNDPIVSAAAGPHPYDKPYTSFRGHSQVTETDPYGNQTVTTYYQDDVKTGRSSSITIWDNSSGSLKKLQTTTTTYNYSQWAAPTLIDISDKTDPLYLEPYDPLYCRFVYTASETKDVYQANGTTIDGSLTTTYDAYDSYGNLTQKTQSGDGVTLVTHTDYFPNTTNGLWLVGLPARTWVTDGTNLLTESLSLYDGANLYTTPPTVGILTATRSLIFDNSYSQTSMTRDAWGNVTSQTAWSGYGTQSSAPTSGARTSTTTYDPTYHTYAVTTTDALGHSYNVTYDYSLGLPVSETDPNGVLTTATYDSFGRFTGLTKPGDSTPTLNVSYQESPYVVTLNQKVDGTHTYTVVRTYDGMGRETLTNTNGILVKYTYDAYGRAVIQSMPRLSGETVYNIITTYDALGRSLTATAPDGAVTTTAYNGLTTTVTDTSGRTTTTISDILGRNLSITPPAGPAVSFTYDALGNMLTAARGGVTSTLTYDSAGRKLTMVDPDMGSWSYGYDALGSMTSQTDARGCTTNLAYDVLSRLTQKTYSNCPTSAPITYGYDAGTNGVGRKTSVSDESGLTAWTYDARGRVVTEAKQIGIYQFTTYFTYNSAELPTSITYPDGEVVNFTYNDQMLLASVIGTETYVQSISYDSSARMTQLVRGNGVLSSVYDYYAWNQQGGRLQGLTTTRNSDQTTLQDLAYTYDPVGNILTITDALAGPQTQTFTYDALDRIVSASVTGGMDGLYSETYGYSATTGNLTAKGGLTIQYTDANHAHAATSATGTGVSNSYGYDANGNQTTRQIGSDAFTLVYDAENRLAEVKKNGATIATFVYDGDGKRVKSVMDGETTLFVGEHYEEVVGGSGTKYYNAGKTRVAMRKDGMLTFLLGDHLNSSSLTTNASGVKTAAMQYKAWGEARYWFNSLPMRYTFTAQYSYMDDPATSGATEGFGLMYYGARWYDPALGRFTQPDTIVPSGPQGYDRYAYTNNNPVRYVDPTGHFIETVFDIISVGMDIADIAQNGLNWGNGISLAVDVASVLIPGIPAVGAAIRAVNAVDNVVDAAKAIDNVVDAANAVDNAVDSAKAAENMIGAVCSFSADTVVATEEGEKAISAIQIGDVVLAWNEEDGTLGFYEVTAVMVHDDEVLTELIIDGEWVETTPEHPFYTEEEGWIPADELKTGMHVAQADGTTGIVWLKWNVHSKQAMYNLTVDTAHTFFVGEGQWLVHNDCGFSPPDRLARVFNADLLDSATTLAKPGDVDAFVTSADDIAGITTADEMAQKLTLVDKSGNSLAGPFAVLEFNTPASGLASPINRTTPGFFGRGVTAGGAQEFVIPNLPIDELEDLFIWIVE